MNELTTIALQATSQELQFLLGGGHAVITHGYPRNTFDLDLVVRRTDKDKWFRFAQSLGYRLHAEGPAFIQFDAPNEASFPLDLMLVNDETFSKLMAGSVEAPSRAKGVRVVSLMHLLAMKCHAVKHGHPGRVVKDADDVIRLIQNNEIDSESPAIRELFLKYGTEEFYEKSGEPAGANSNNDLDFPDWSGMDSSSARLSPEAAFRLCEQYALMFPNRASKRRDEPKCEVEFIL